MFDTKLYEDKFNQVVSRFQEELKKIRTGRAHPGQLDGVKVEVYGTFLPLNQVANITAPEAQLLQITPFDPGNLNAICVAIRADQNLGFDPSDDGHTIRVSVPPLNEERRRALVKQASEKTEEAKITLRNIRQEAIKDVRHKKDAKELSEDDAKRITKGVDDDISEANNKVDQAFQLKEKDILKV